jgi:hypothetical protein
MKKSQRDFHLMDLKNRGITILPNIRGYKIVDKDGKIIKVVNLHWYDLIGCGAERLYNNVTLAIWDYDRYVVDAVKKRSVILFENWQEEVKNLNQLINESRNKNEVSKTPGTS